MELVLLSVILGLTNYLYLKDHEPTARTLFQTVITLVVEPLFLGYLVSPSLSLWNTFAIYIAFFTSLITSVLLYRLSPLHPLHSVPGPLLAKTTKLWTAYLCWKGKQYLALKELHDKYGPIVRIAPNEVSVQNVESIKEVLGPDGMPKGQAYGPRRDPRTKGSVLVLNGEDHRNRRRLWNRGMNTDSLREYEDIIKRRARELVDALKSRKDGEVDLNEWFSFFSFDFMADMAFGGKTDMLTKGEDENGYLELIEHGSRYIDLICKLPWLAPILGSIPFIKKSVLRLRGLGVKWSTERVQKGGETKDLWYHLSDEANLEQDRPALATVAGEGVLAIIAGSDTTSAALAYTIYYLLRNPECYRKARKEVDEVFNAGTIDALDTTQEYGRLAYVAACINESMRLMPPVPSNGPREVVNGGKMLCGHFLPEGTQVQVAPYCIHRNPANFSPRTEEYVPERWLESGSGAGYATNTEAFIPFSYGPSNCAGRNLAKREMIMLFAVLLQQFDMRFGKGKDEGRWVEGWLDRTKEYFVTVRDPLWVIPTPR
ncbi:hypothetical protein VNI00_012853 [Paramarasmius palmivorus]|uniref:Cytochrome P450 n=1 Tax=Paramarasmius palmivorus TaxID=297713 RepID=A0AAW0C1H8_9AGAR